MMKKKNSLKNQPGVSTLLLVFIIASLLAMIIFVLHPISLLAARRANQLRYAQTAFFAAEGALYETIQHLRDNPDWPSSLPYEDPHPYMIGEAEIKRILSEGSEGEIVIDITATIKGRKRKLVATFTREGENPTPVDIILIIDRSGSMDELGSNQPITDALNAAKAFVEKVEEHHQPGEDREGIEDRIGVVTYSTNAEIYQPLGTSFAELEAALDPATNIGINILIEGWTNIGGSLYLAKKDLFEDHPHPNPETHQAIVLLTDGCANAAFREPEANPPIVTECTGSLSEIWPESETSCTNYAKTKAAEVKNNGAIIFTIALLGYIEHEYEEAADFSREILENNIASRPEYFKDVYESENLREIYQAIAEAVISPEFFKYQEEVPEPD